MRAIIIEDEPLSVAELRTTLAEIAPQIEVVATASSVAEAAAVIAGVGHDLIFMDIHLGDGSGFDIFQRTEISVPVIFITAKDTENDTVTGFNLGADDYISKPFSLREVIARVKAVLRRTATTETEKVPERLVYQSLVIDITKKKVSIDDEEVPLTKKEFEILLLLVQNKGRVFSREDILARIWSDEVYVLDRTIDVNITRLRKKIGEYGKCIVTRLGYGYCFEAE